MPTNLTGSTIASTYSQLLHVDGGLTASEKTVYSGTGVASALKLGTVSASIGNIRFDGNTIAATTGDLTLGSNIAFSNPGNARTALGLGTIVTQAANNVAITGGSISNVAFTGSFSGMTLVEATTLTGVTTTNGGNLRMTGNTLSSTNTDGDINLTPNGTGRTVASALSTTSPRISTGILDANGNEILKLTATASAANELTLANAALGSGPTLSATGTDTNIDINITPKGTGEVNVTNIDVISGKVPFATITNRAYGQFYSTQDQTAAVDTATAVTFNNSDAMNTGITVASNSRITFAAAGDYDVYFSIQLINAENADHEVTFWLRLNGTDLPNSATRIVVPASAVGGTGFFAFNTLVRVTAGQYVEVYWATEDADVSLNYEAAQTLPFPRPVIPSAVLTANRIG